MIFENLIVDTFVFLAILVFKRRNVKQTALINMKKHKRISGKKKDFNSTFRMFQHTS